MRAPKHPEPQLYYKAFRNRVFFSPQLLGPCVCMQNSTFVTAKMAFWAPTAEESENVVKGLNPSSPDLQ